MKWFGKPQRPPYRIFFATDVHGSDRCFRKFLAAASGYEADALVLGGDVAGKALVPIVPDGGGHFTYTLHGQRETVATPALDEAKKILNFHGYYPHVTESRELQVMNEQSEYVVSLFEQKIVAQLSGWCELAAERLPAPVRCIITPGNDDPPVIDDVLEGASKVECPERATVELGPVWLASLGNTNRTPWDTDREFDEPELAKQIAEMVDPVSDGRPLVFNFHCPPYGTELDQVVKLDHDLRPVTDRGEPVLVPVGSTAVREAIERYRPVAGLHGHIHESVNVTRLGPSWCFNPGSEYGSGVLKGLILDLEETGDVRSHLFTTG